MKKICIAIGSRANYSSIKSVLEEIKKNPQAFKLQIVVFASALIEKYGDVRLKLKNDGFKIDAEVFCLLEGTNPQNMAKSTGIALLELPTVFSRLNPDFILTIGDRFETMATSVAASYMNIILVHTMGGEISGTIDESIRHSITKLSHLHFAANKTAASNIKKLGEYSNSVFNVGCPRVDQVSKILKTKKDDSTYKIINEIGVGFKIDFKKKYLILSYHPVTSEYGSAEDQIIECLKAIKKVGEQSIVLWPNADAGSDDIVKGIRKWREFGLTNKMRFIKHLDMEDYITLMKNTCCLIGNSSSGIREGSFIGTPTVDIGTRQQFREIAKNVLRVKCNALEITKAINKQINHGKYKKSTLYGDGKASKRIVDILYKKKISTQKRLCWK